MLFVYKAQPARRTGTIKNERFTEDPERPEIHCRIDNNEHILRHPLPVHSIIDLYNTRLTGT